MNIRNAPPLAYRPDIDGLRAFAVLFVVAFHAFPGTLQSGFIGVDVFFVISGYLISGIILNDLQRGTFSLRNFYRRRIRRIFPALLVVLATVLLFGWFTLFPEEFRSLGGHVVGGAAFIANFLFWHEVGYFDVAARGKPLLHLWSLGIEEQFYIFFPLLLWCCAKKHLRTASVVIGIGAVSFLVNIVCMQDQPMDFYSPYTRIWELLAGSALCIAMRQASTQERYLKLDSLAGKILHGGKQENDGRCLSRALAVLGVVFLSAALLLVRESDPYPGWNAVLPVSGTLLLIAAGPFNPLSRHLLANRGIVFIGLVSYPFYLWHWALLSYAFVINGGPDASTPLLRAALVTASFLLAVLTYVFVETPIRFGAWARSGTTTFALVGGMIAVGMAGVAVSLTNGLPGRTSAKQYAAIATQLLPPTRVDREGLAYAGIEPGMLGFCKYTDAGAEETVAVIGDSHAHSAYWGIAKLGLESGYNTVLLGWLVPGAELWNKLAPARTDFMVNRKRVFDIVKKKNDIRKVFIVTRGMLYIAGTRVFQGKVEKTLAALEKKYHVGYEVFKQSMQSYVDILKESGKEVFILSENPELPATVRDYVARPFRETKQGTFPAVYKADVIKRQSDYLQLLSEIRNATVIDTVEPLCSGGKCLVFIDNVLPMYYDDDHLSLVGSEFQAERILKPYLAGSKGEGLP